LKGKIGGSRASQRDRFTDPQARHSGLERRQRQTQVGGCIKFALQHEAKVPDACRARRSLTQTNSKSHSYQLKPLSVRLFCLALGK
jgi:hypothetical protein